MADKLAKAMITPLDGRQAGKPVEVMFNPTEYSVEYSANFQESSPPGLSNPVLQFVNGGAETLNLEFLFDTHTDGDGANVLDLTQKFIDMVKVDGSVHAPPRVEFRWGVYRFVAVVEKISQRLTIFKADGTPVRATLTVAFKQYKTVAQQLQDPRRNSADKTKRRLFESPDSLWLIAAREYGEARYWRLIARANDIDDPLAIEPGQVLVLPPIDPDSPLGSTNAAG